MFRLMLSLLVLITVPTVGVAQERHHTTLEEVYGLALERNPMIRASKAAADAVRERESASTLPPDPTFEFGVMNASLPGLRTDMPTSMLPSVQVMQMVPLPGKLRLAGELARRDTDIARAAVSGTEWEVRAGVATAFYDLYLIDRQLAVMAETLDWLRQFEEVATSTYSVGGGRQSDVLRISVEVALMQAEIARTRASRQGAVARLNALIDRSPDAQFERVEFTPLPAELPSPEVLQTWAEETQPALAIADSEVLQAHTRQSLARRELWPDFSVGLQYGQRESDMGTERMGSLMIGFSLPVFASRRQIPMRHEAAAMGAMAEAEYADELARIGALIVEITADLDRARTLTVLFRTEVLPLAEANLTSALSAYRVGRVDFMTLLDALMTLNEYQLTLHTLISDYGIGIARLESAIGREIPMTLEPFGDES